MTTHVGGLTGRHAASRPSGPRGWDALLSWLARVAEPVRKPIAIRAVARSLADERILAFACRVDDTFAVATDRALHCQDAGRPEAWTLVGWEQVGRVDWDEERRTLTLTGLVPNAPKRTVLHLRGREPLVALAYERVA